MHTDNDAIVSALWFCMNRYELFFHWKREHNKHTAWRISPQYSLKEFWLQPTVQRKVGILVICVFLRSLPHLNYTLNSILYLEEIKFNDWNHHQAQEGWLKVYIYKNLDTFTMSTVHRLASLYTELLKFICHAYLPLHWQLANLNKTLKCSLTHI